MKKLSVWKKKPNKSERYTEVDNLTDSNIYDEFDEMLYLPDNDDTKALLFEGMEDVIGSSRNLVERNKFSKKG